MAFKIQVVRSAKPGTGSTLNIPQEVKDELEGTYEALRTNDGTEAHVAFDTEDEAKTFKRQAIAYCKSREAGALKFRQLPSKHLPATEMRFTISADLETNGARNDQSKV